MSKPNGCSRAGKRMRNYRVARIRPALVIGRSLEGLNVFVGYGDVEELRNLKSAFVEALVFRRSNRLLPTLGRLFVSGYRLTSPHSS